MNEELEKKLEKCIMDEGIHDLGFECLGHIPKMVAEADDIDIKQAVKSIGPVYNRVWLWKNGDTYIKVKDLGNTYCTYLNEVSPDLIETLRNIVRAENDINARKRKNRRDTTDKLENLRMNKEVYKLRRRVIDIIYDALDLHSLPRITVRVTKSHDDILGRARLDEGQNILWITQEAIEDPDWDLRRTVYHEILHTVFNVPHIEGDLLMDAGLDPGKHDREKMDRLFKKHAEAYE